VFGDAIKAVAKRTPLRSFCLATIFLCRQTAVPTGEAHRLPKKCAFLSGKTGEVKAARDKIEPGQRLRLGCGSAASQTWALTGEIAMRCVGNGNGSSLPPAGTFLAQHGGHPCQALAHFRTSS
jgi:hypothetical protein